MAEEKLNSGAVQPSGRPLGQTEYSMCRGVYCGTGIAVIAFLFSKPPQTSRLNTALHKLQSSHPVFRSKLHSDTATNSFSFITFPKPFIQSNSFDLAETHSILESIPPSSNSHSISPFHLLLEHELNLNSWCNNPKNSTTTTDIFLCTIYALPNSKWVVALRFHVAACDRTTAISTIRQFVVLMDDQDIDKETGNKGEGLSLAFEDLIPYGKTKKPLWARGKDMLSFSLDALRTSTLNFIDAKSTKSSEVLRLQLDADETLRVLDGCKSRGIKLCAALVAAGLIATHGFKRHHNHQRKYLVGTLVDCRSLLESPLSDHHFGTYQSTIPSTHVVKRGEKLWDVATKYYSMFENAKNNNRHFTDIADINFLMCKAIETPGLSTSSLAKTALLTVFEETVIEEDSSHPVKQCIGLEDYMGCASVHGIGPSIVMFDTIRDGRLDCVCVYPSPQHSRDQIRQLLDKMKAVLVDSSNYTQSE